MTSLYKYLAKYRYCISGSFALSVIDGIDNRNDQHWRNGDIDIYVSLPKTNANRFRDFHSGLATWWRNIRYLFHYSRVKVDSTAISIIAKFGRRRLLSNTLSKASIALKLLDNLGSEKFNLSF
jgi:hypothetical protein